MGKNKDLKGLGGWLIVVGLGLFVSVARMTYSLIAVYYPLFSDGTFIELTTPGKPLYSPLWAPMLIVEVFICAVFNLTFAYLIYLFFTKHYRFPKIYIVTLLASAVQVPLDTWLYSLVLKDQPIFDYETFKETVRALMITFVWVPYVLVSKRVKATFVEHRPEAAQTYSATAL